MRPGDLDMLWRGAGLRDVREGQITVRMEFADFDDMWQPLNQGPGLGLLYNGLSPGWQQKVGNAIRGDRMQLVGGNGPRGRLR